MRTNRKDNIRVALGRAPHKIYSVNTPTLKGFSFILLILGFGFVLLLMVAMVGSISTGAYREKQTTGVKIKVISSTTLSKQAIPQPPQRGEDIVIESVSKSVPKGEWNRETLAWCGQSMVLNYHHKSRVDWAKYILLNKIDCGIIKKWNIVLTLYPDSDIICGGRSPSDGCYRGRNKIDVHTNLDEAMFMWAFYHEYGHQLYRYGGIDTTEWIGLSISEKIYVSDYARQSAKKGRYVEDFCETFAFVMLNTQGGPLLKTEFIKEYIASLKGISITVID